MDSLGTKYDDLRTMPEGSASLEGAQYTVKFYASPTASGNPTRTWIYQSDESGNVVLYNSNYKIGGDALYYENGHITFPLGTITVQETKAPEGYLLSSTVYTGHVNRVADSSFSTGYTGKFTWDDGTLGAQVDYNTQSGETGLPDVVKAGDVQITKYDDERGTTEPHGDATLEGTEFTIYNLNANPVLKLDGCKFFSFFKGKCWLLNYYKQGKIL